MTADALLSAMGPIAGFIVTIAIFLLGFGMLHMIGRPNA